MSFFSDVERDLVVAGRTLLADGVLAVDLVSHNGRDLPAWTPGAHLDLLLGPGLERQYSLCGDVADRTRWRVAVLREDGGRGGSVAVHERVQVGERLRVRGPRNHFPYDPTPGSRHHFVAGGIGITPLRAMVAVADAAGVDWTLDYAGRSRSTMAFVEELSTAHPERVRVHAADEGGRFDVTSLRALPADTGLHVCGPARLIDAVQTALADRPEDAVHVERFEAVDFGAPVWDGPFEVELALSGLTVTVEPGQTVLEAVEAEDVLVLSSCREGTCGTCETPVLEGPVEHRDSILSEGERAADTVMMVCVSRAAGPRLVLDL